MATKRPARPSAGGPSANPFPGVGEAAGAGQGGRGPRTLKGLGRGAGPPKPDHPPCCACDAPPPFAERDRTGPPPRVTDTKPAAGERLPQAQGPGRIGTITPVASANLNGTTFVPALTQTTDTRMQMGLAVYDVGRRCTQLTTWVGAAPAEPGQAPTNATAYIDVGAYDGPGMEPVASAGASPLAPHPVQLTVGPDQIAGADLLALQVVQGNLQQFTLEWGRPMILCSF